jgi:hypothetical protein
MSLCILTVNGNLRVRLHRGVHTAVLLYGDTPSQQFVCIFAVNMIIEQFDSTQVINVTVCTCYTMYAA